MIKRLTLASLAVVALLAAFAGTASAQSFKGTVVHRNAKAQRFVVADKAGHMRAIHARKTPRVGRVVKVTARKLSNGTFALTNSKVVGRARRARLHGTVTWVNRRTGAFVVSSRGASILVRRHKARGARAADSATPSVGEVVTVDATLDDQGDVEEQGVTHDGENMNGMDVHGMVLAIDTTARTLSISADDDDESKSALTVNVPATFDLSKFSVNQEVELVVTPNPDGTYTLVSTSGGDDSVQEADDTSDDQGDDPTATDHKSTDSKPAHSGKGSDD